MTDTPEGVVVTQDSQPLNERYPEAYRLMLRFYCDPAYYNSNPACRPADNVLMAIQYALAHTAAPRTEEVERNLEAQRQAIKACARVADTFRAAERSKGNLAQAHVCDDIASAIKALRPNEALASLPPSDVHTRQGGDGRLRQALEQAEYALSVIADELSGGDLHNYAKGQQGKLANLLRDSDATPTAPMQTVSADKDRHPGWTERGHAWLDAGAPLAPVSADKDAGEVEREAIVAYLEACAVEADRQADLLSVAGKAAAIQACQQEAKAYRNSAAMIARDDHAGHRRKLSALTAPPIAIHGETFPREAVAEAIRLVEYDMLNRAGHGADGFVAERKEVAQIIEAYRALLQERQS